ncbi:MAG: ATP synthase F1 subunit delta [Silvibacterium sp.]|nr:ATP synthase F1 subunit delta [Silvibacterium sp.]
MAAALEPAYARALADVVLTERLDPAQVESNLADFAAAWHESAPLREVFLDPSFSIEEKVAILDKLNRRLQMTQVARNFVAVLVRHDRLLLYDDILKEFRHEMNRRLGISEVEVTTARKLDDPSRAALESQIAGLTRGRIAATFHEDASLMGGAIVRIGSTVYDGSIRGRLDRLEAELAASQA